MVLTDHFRLCSAFILLGMLCVSIVNCGGGPDQPPVLDVDAHHQESREAPDFKALYADQFARTVAYDYMLLDLTLNDEHHYSWVRKTVVADLFEYWIRTNSPKSIIDESDIVRHQIGRMVSKHDFTSEELSDPFLYGEQGFERGVPFLDINRATFGDIDGYNNMVSEFIVWLDRVQGDGRARPVGTSRREFFESEGRNGSD